MLTIYAPSNKPQSKCWEVFKGIQASWSDQVKIHSNDVPYFLHDDSDSMFWGLVNNNTNLIHQICETGQTWWFTDTPYFGRFDNNNLQPDNHYWRICKDNIHVSYVAGLDTKRISKFNVAVKSQRQNGEHILVCPSSNGIHGFLGIHDWLEKTVTELKKHTDRPIIVRHKPRGRGTSGPSEAVIPIQQQLKNAWACVTSCSISAVESMCEGVPVFCHENSFAKPIGNINLDAIENPQYSDPTSWLNSLSYQQFTPEEFSNGTAVGTLKELKILS